MIDHIDILKDGASSIYGSDAVAGVVNIVTKSNFDGVDVHGHLEPSQDGGGNIYQFDVTAGKTFDKGYITASFDYYRQDPLTRGQRNYLNCSRDLVRDAATGASADIIDPATGQSKCENFNPSQGVVDLGVARLPRIHQQSRGGRGRRPRRLRRQRVFRRRPADLRRRRRPGLLRQCASRIADRRRRDARVGGA